jgi:glycosyltransferase involved in cell wall biosynthesis
MSKVSFVLPTYNYAQYLTICVHSILAQDYDNLDIVIVDDASSDDTPAVARQLCAEDSRVSYFRHEVNVGPVNNWNTCLEKATGELVWLISADDVLSSPQVLSRLVQRFAEYPNLGFAFCRAQIIDENGAAQSKWIPRMDTIFPAPKTPMLYPGPVFFKQLIKTNFVPVLGTLARKVCYEQTGGFVPDLIHCGDWYNWLRFSLYWDVFFEPEAMVGYRQHSSNLSRNYAQRSYPVENTLLCYEHVRAYIRKHDLSEELLKAVDVAEILFRRNKNLPRSFQQRMKYRMLKLAGQL